MFSMYLGMPKVAYDGIPRYIENIENILRKSICQSVLRPNLASKKKTLASSKKHKNINIVPFWSRCKRKIKSDFDVLSRPKKTSFQYIFTLLKYYDAI